MSLETASFIKDLVATNPQGTDPKSQGDDHLRMIKAVLQAQFSGFTEGAAINLTESQLNALGAGGLGGEAVGFTDANALPAVSGFFRLTTAGTNVPSGAAIGDTLLQTHGPSGRTQLFEKKANGLLYGRGFNGTTWSAWQTVMTGFRQGFAYDGAADALMVVGAFGLGANAQPIATAFNIDFSPAFTCIAGIVAGMTGTLPPGSAAGDILFHLQYNASTAYQQYFCFANQMLFTRRGGAGTWSTWLPVASVGVGQVWTNVAASRALTTTFTNTTPRPITVSMSTNCTANANSWVDIVVAGLTIGRQQVTYQNGSPWLPLNAYVNFMVPAGATYAVNLSTGPGALTHWCELR